MRVGVALGRYAFRRRLESFAQRAHAFGRSAGVSHDAATGCEDQIRGAEAASVPAACLADLSGREHRHCDARFVGEHWARTGSRRFDHAFVRFAELVGKPIDVHVVRAGETPELLPGDVRPSKRRMP